MTDGEIIELKKEAEDKINIILNEFAEKIPVYCKIDLFHLDDKTISENDKLIHKYQYRITVTKEL